MNRARAKGQKKRGWDFYIERISQMIFVEASVTHPRDVWLVFLVVALERNQANCSEFTVLGFC